MRSSDKQFEGPNGKLKYESKIEEIMKYSRDVSYKINLETESYEYLSSSIENILNWPKTLFLEQGRTFTKKIMHPDDISLMEAIISSVHEEPEEYHDINEIDFRLRHKNGSYHWFLDRFTVKKDSDTNIRYIIGTFIDITDRKLIEIALLETEKKFRNFLDQAPFDIQLYGLDGFLQFVNKMDNIMWGIEPETVIGKYNVFQDEQLKDNGIFLDVQEAYKGNYPSSKEIYFDPKLSGLSMGDAMWLHTTIFPLKNEKNKVTSISVIHQDISAQKQNLLKLQESEEKYNQLFQKSRDAIVLQNTSGNIIEANFSAITLFGYSREEFLTFVTNDLHPTDKKRLDGKITQEFLKGSRASYDVMMQRKDGTLFESIVMASIVTIFEETYIQVIIQDVSELKRRDAERLRTQKIESIALLAGGIAHDFNNILVGILGNTNLMQMDEDLSSELKDSLNDIEKATLRASELTKQLLTFSKGGAPLKKTHDITTLLQESLSFVMRGSKSKCRGIEGEKNLPSVEVDSGQMTQVFNNILINANQAMDSGGEIFLTLRVVNLQNSLEIPLPNGHYIQISIKDQGGGIPPALHQHIFEPYFTTKEQGNGLGLATCYSIIKRHGGYITYESTLDVGTTFHIYLPINERELEKRNEIIAGLKPTKDEFSGNVIIMDDDPMILKTLAKILTKLGLSVDIAHDGHELIEQYQEAFHSTSKYDLVIMDLTIPGGFGGKETISMLIEFDPKILAIVSSGYSNDPIVAQYKEWGFAQILNKPYTIKDVRNILEEFL